MPHQQEIKAIRLLQLRSAEIADAHISIGTDLTDIRRQLELLGAAGVEDEPEFASQRQARMEKMNVSTALEDVSIYKVYDKAEQTFPNKLGLADILAIEDFQEAQRRVDTHVLDFNHRYGLDGWDYAIAGGCGLFAAMLDILCVKAPPKPTTPWQKQVDGIFNRWVQDAFNKILPPELSDKLSKANRIGSADARLASDLLGAPDNALAPLNHRLRSLAHDPVLGLILGVLDMIRGTCTIVVNGEIRSFQGVKGPTDGNIFQLIGRMFGHLLSDVNAPSAHGNRGMGLPAPFMGLLRMFEGIPVGDSNFGKQIEWMYVNGYDFRQFVVSSVPMTIMEVLLRVFYVVKQVRIYNAKFGETLLDTMPFRLNPRFRMILAMSYGVTSAANAGKIYITKNIMNANYAAWMGLVWNGFHALKWALLDRHLKLWNEIEAKEIAELEKMIIHIDKLETRAVMLPI